MMKKSRQERAGQAERPSVGRVAALEASEGGGREDGKTQSPRWRKFRFPRT